MISVWIHNRLNGTPDAIMTWTLIALAVILLIIAVTAPAWVKLASIVWVVAP